LHDMVRGLSKKKNVRSKLTLSQNVSTAVSVPTSVTTLDVASSSSSVPP
jgi:hypothetical protein